MAENEHHNIDPRRITRQHEKAMAELMNISASMSRPMFNYQAESFRMASDIFEAWQRNIEKVGETLTTVAEQTAATISREASRDQPSRERGGGGSTERTY
jgi:hypothetical protein